MTRFESPCTGATAARPRRTARRHGALLALLVGLAVAPSWTGAWGVQGHRWIAAQAQRLLSPSARQAGDALLAQEPGATLESIATWADETRTPATAAWHYVNLPEFAHCRYDAERDCPNGQCVVAAIESYQRILQSSAPDTQRLQALKFLVHFVADVHQPLHAGHPQDRGGNRFQVQAYGRGTNLHAVWDSALLEHLPDVLASPVHVDPADAQQPLDPVQWAEESCRIVDESWFYPAIHRIEPDYESLAAPVLRARLTRAAQRLAELLNRTLGSPR